MNWSKLLFNILIFLFSFSMYSQKGESVIHFEDGTTKKWYIRNILHYKKDNKFHKTAARIELTDEKSNEIILYEYLELKKGKKRFLAKVIYQGKKASLYSRLVLHNRPVEYFPTNNPTNKKTSEADPMADIHYARKTNETLCSEISLEGGNAIYGSKFKKKASKFFFDCPILVKKILNKEIKNSNKIEAFKFYDEECK